MRISEGSESQMRGLSGMEINMNGEFKQNFVWEINMNQINVIKIGLCVLLITTSIMVQPAIAWGPMTHLAITSELTSDMNVQASFNGGGLGPDTFYYIGDNNQFSALAHSKYSADLPKKMLDLANGNRLKEAYANGWWSHYGSDPYGHGYVSTKINYPYSHETIEFLIDANTANKVKSLEFDVPYGFLQLAYKNVYGEAPSTFTIYYAVKIQQASIYIEKSLISKVPNALKYSYNDFGDYYDASITTSKDAINNPDEQTNIDLNIGKYPFASFMISTASGIQEKEKHARIDKDIRDVADELLTNGAIEVNIEEDTLNEVFRVKEPSVKNKKKFDEAIEKLAQKKKIKK